MGILAPQRSFSDLLEIEPEAEQKHNPERVGTCREIQRISWESLSGTHPLAGSP